MKQRNIFKFIIFSLFFILLAACGAGNAETSEGKTKTASETKQETLNATTDSVALKGHTVMIDPGHGGRDPGSVESNVVHEKDLITNTSDAIKKALRNAGANVIMTRTEDEKVSLEDRRNMSNEESPEAFISVHYNTFTDPSVSGFSTYYFSKEKDHQLAQSINQSLTAAIELRDRGVKENNYFVLNDNDAPSILLELGFMSNPEELATIQSEEYDQIVGAAIVDGLKNYFEAS
ncbi:hypothetical protein J32TS6_35240 [Virgibacillus pantothenticus]|uniref:N-acetylmuramoyl-L-alanine amidase family protein n=1 Tax=Virgibacillus TaxID=84406 RepID=UPI0009099437|nr:MULTISPECIES: N-acetylmuramoyl-L-alanine amidase [Virgibacillus]API92263.1 hypothetical protein BKP57_10720 [Virgibacillus sp. 6R]MBS7427138.1 N-acetylmuramoyl-L-alanine amidase [Virgibacillus sp. 19R1-5]GIP64969.1 hypothetical protein J32TS6_35240 [Virgibacillus pantothenticus]